MRTIPGAVKMRALSAARSPGYPVAGWFHFCRKSVPGFRQLINNGRLAVGEAQAARRSFQLLRLSVDIEVPEGGRLLPKILPG